MAAHISTLCEGCVRSALIDAENHLDAISVQSLAA